MELSMMAMLSPVLAIKANCLVRQNSCLPWMRKRDTEMTNQRETTVTAKHSSTDCRTNRGFLLVRRHRLALGTDEPYTV